MGEPSGKPADHAGVYFPPPLIYVLVLGGALVMDRYRPLPFAANTVLRAIGATLVVVGAMLALASFRAFHRAGTTPIPIKPSTALVGSGPFRFSRNPMYVAMLLAYAGVGILLHTWWPLMLAPVVVLLVQVFVIRREERYLERRFGEPYRRYMQQVRRWV